MIVVLKFLPFGEVLFLGCDRWIVVARAGTVGVVVVGLAVGVVVVGLAVGVLIGLAVGVVVVGLAVRVLIGLAVGILVGLVWLIPNEGGWRGWRVGLGVGVEVFT